MARVVSVPYRSPCDTTTSGRWFVLPSACLCACHARPSWPAGRRPRTGSISCGETFFQHRQPIDPSSLTRWRNRIGEEGVEWLLTETIEAGKRSGAVKGSDLKRVTVDTTVMEKNIAHPTDARLFEAARCKLVGLAREAGLGLRQSYSRLAPRLAGQVGRTAHARQCKRMRKARCAGSRATLVGCCATSSGSWTRFRRAG